MPTCANCSSSAEYNYENILYCNSHLPRFLRTKSGVVGDKVTYVAEQPLIISAEVIPSQPIVEETPAVDQIEASSTPKKKDAPKA